MLRYRLKSPIPAIYDKPGGGHLRVSLPANSILIEPVQHSTTLMGMVGVVWEGGHYSIFLSALLTKAERVEGA